MHRFDFLEDRIVWDVGHQAYPYKILTGRKDRFHTLRQHDGLSGFQKRDESVYDHFGAGPRQHQHLRRPGHGQGPGPAEAGLRLHRRHRRRLHDRRHGLRGPQPGRLPGDQELPGDPQRQRHEHQPQRGFAPGLPEPDHLRPVLPPLAGPHRRRHQGHPAGERQQAPGQGRQVERGGVQAHRHSGTPLRGPGLPLPGPGQGPRRGRPGQGPGGGPGEDGRRPGPAARADPEGLRLRPGREGSPEVARRDRLRRRVRGS